MQAWHDGKLTAGNLRAQLQQKAWSSYGDGLWREPWSDFMREFSRAVQTYAHYTQKLSLWQFHALSQPMPGDNGALLFAMHVGPDPDDDEKTNQVAVLHALLLWWIGRILLFHRPEIGACVKPLVESLGTGLRGSGLLAEGYSWADMLLPVVCSTEPRGT